MRDDASYTGTFLAVKLLDIGLVTVYFFLIGITAAKWFDYMNGDLDVSKYEEKHSFIIFLDIIMQLFILGVFAYVLRNIVEMIPFPFEGVAGFHHHRLKELHGGPALEFILLFFQQNLRKKIALFAQKVFGFKSTELPSIET